MRSLVFVASLVVACASHATPLPRFPAGSVWSQDISTAPVLTGVNDPIPTLAGLGGFGNGGLLQIDFSFHVVNAPAGSPTRTVSGYPYDDYYLPDCEPIGSTVPTPPGAAIEGETDLTCDNDPNSDTFADCHLLVVQGSTLYELYEANASV